MSETKEKPILLTCVEGMMIMQALIEAHANEKGRS